MARFPFLKGIYLPQIGKQEKLSIAASRRIHRTKRELKGKPLGFRAMKRGPITLISDSPLHGKKRTFLRLPELRRGAWPLAGQVRILRGVEHAGRRGHRRDYDAGLDPLQTQGP